MEKNQTIRLTASRKQGKFFFDQHRYVAYGGARGGGKSWAIRINAINLAVKYPGIVQVIVRRSYPELRENHINEFLKFLPKEYRKYNDSRKEMTIYNGSVIKFRYCANDRDLDNFQGTEFDILYIDEGTHFTEEQFRAMDACVRGVNPYPKRTYITCNPGGVGHSWVKRLFVDRAYKDEEREEDYSFIQATVYDNKALMKAQPDYVKNLENLPAKRREAWLYGKWDIFEGQVFEELRISPDMRAAEEAGCKETREALMQQHRWTHVIEPIDLSTGAAKNWKIYRSYDFGFSHPFSCAWWAVDYDGVLYRVMELYGCTETPDEGVRWNADEQFRKIAETERTHPWLKGKKIMGIADPAIWDASRGESIADTAAKYQLYFTPGDNNRIPGWMQVHYRLQFDEEGYARMYVFNNCAAFIRTMPLMQYSTTQVEDVDTRLEDHVADEVRYMCMSRPVAPLMPREERKILSDPLDMFRKK